MAGFDPNQPRNEDGEWSKAEASARKTAGIDKEYSIEDFEKAAAYSIDGFGNYNEYLQSDFVEVLEFRGDYFNKETKELLTNHQIIIIDRCILVSHEPIENWLGKTNMPGNQ